MKQKGNFIHWICRLTSTPRFNGSYLFQPQSGADHAFRTSMIAMQIVDHYNAGKDIKDQISREEVVLKALLHDVEESVIGDLPTPVKYITPDFREEFKKIEEKAIEDYVLRDAGPKAKEYKDLWQNAKNGQSGKIIKLADKIEGFIKINFEILHGNRGLESAYVETMQWFIEHPEMLKEFSYADKLVKEYQIPRLDLLMKKG